MDELVKPTEVFKKLFGPYVKSKQALNVLTAALAHELREKARLLLSPAWSPEERAQDRGRRAFTEMGGPNGHALYRALQSLRDQRGLARAASSRSRIRWRIGTTTASTSAAV